MYTLVPCSNTNYNVPTKYILRQASWETGFMGIESVYIKVSSDSNQFIIVFVIFKCIILIL